VTIEIAEERNVAVQAQLEKRSRRSTTVARAPPGAETAPELRLTRSWKSARSGALQRSSTLPPVALVAASRDLITRVSFITSRSPGATSRGRSMKARSASAAPSTCNRRLPVRSGEGTCAISSRGSS
jgi:hypothetical protein